MKPASDTPPPANCRRCPRLADYRRRLKKTWPDHFSAPVPGWGSLAADLLIVGLAPGLHGAHRTGIPFWGDASGDLLMAALADAGFATPDRPSGLPVRITNAFKCLPPKNLPGADEVEQCQRFLRAELESMDAEDGCILTLGGVAHRAVVKALGHKQSELPFGHGRRHRTNQGMLLVSSYHPSRLNINTRRLTPAQFHQVIRSVAVSDPKRQRADSVGSGQ